MNNFQYLWVFNVDFYRTIMSFVYLLKMTSIKQCFARFSASQLTPKCSEDFF